MKIGMRSLLSSPVRLSGKWELGFNPTHEWIFGPVFAKMRDINIPVPTRFICILQMFLTLFRAGGFSAPLQILKKKHTSEGKAANGI